MRRKTFGELRYSASCATEFRGCRSIARSAAMAPAMENPSTAMATRFTRRVAVILRPAAAVKLSWSLQVPTLKNQHRCRNGHRRIKQRIYGVVQNQLARHSITVRYLCNDVERGEIRNQVRNGRRYPSLQSVGDAGKAS